MIEPALKGLTRGSASILLITVLPGGFLLHLSSGIVINVAHSYAWDKGIESKEAIVSTLRDSLQKICDVLPERPRNIAIEGKLGTGV